MRIIQVASEMAPLAKVGGLADVILGLSRELKNIGEDVAIIIPKYDCLESSDIKDLTIAYEDVPTTYKGNVYQNSIWTGTVESIKVYFLEPHHPKEFFNRGCFYGCEDDSERYLYFSRAVADFLVKGPLKPDIVHIHDWQTAAIAPIFKELYPTIAPKIVFTIHNLEYQGQVAPFNLDWIGLPSTKLLNPDLMGDYFNPRDLNLLKGAIAYSDYITTVSPTYAWEIMTPEGGRGLNRFISRFKNKFEGILNGLDYIYWNPETDRYLPAPYSSRITPQSKTDSKTLDKKGYVKRILREKLMLSEEHMPIVGCVTRLVPQKGIELIKQALKRTLEKNGQFVLLGSSPIPEITEEFHELKQKYDDHPHVHLVLHHQEDIAHLIYGGSDLFIVPSLFEPCGLTQLIALRYGSIPVVRKTGGLADTIFDIDYSPKSFNETNGFVFDHPDIQGINSALDRAIFEWFKDPERWRKLIVQGMNMDFSWKKPAEKYLAIYKRL